MADYAKWVREKIVEHAPETTTDAGAAIQLAHAWAALAGQGKNLFGLEPPAELPEREQLREECLAVLKRWIPTLDKPTKETLRTMMTGYAVPLASTE